MAMAIKNHLTLNFYKGILELQPQLPQKEVHDNMKGVYNITYSGSNQVKLQFCKFFGSQVLTDKMIQLDTANVLKGYKDILRFCKDSQL